MDFELINSREFAKRVIDYKIDKNIYSELQKIHYELFKKNFPSNCGTCVKQAYVLIREKINNDMIFQTQEPAPMKQFELKKSVSGISQQIHIDHDIITNDNLTDETAISILSKYPSHIVTFSRYPENWQQLVGRATINPNEERIEIPIAELKTVIIAAKKVKKAKK